MAVTKIIALSMSPAAAVTGLYELGNGDIRALARDGCGSSSHLTHVSVTHSFGCRRRGPAILGEHSSRESNIEANFGGLEP